ncbi:non-ribosomal peptide synthetase [Undibacterium sp. TS12]|uniref:non-ribosomal peptide synthetase n=1 Tax=Undibacterium sp. TS12 TaxID=2908202 RepID=UPI001F4CD31B|nr:non-ribosomal peptide synthetase [Undibacterium sp. TS12]MCH8619393.1 amino acid adenylation domain-containing protein [Undibacterium sp. TS12]
MAQKISAAQTTQAGLSIPPVTAAPGHQPPPLSFAQQRLWFLDQLDPGSPLYNVPTAVRLHGPMNVHAFERALNDVVARHEILRTCFREFNDEPAQFIVNDLNIVIKQHDLRALPHSEREAKAAWLVQDEAQTSFDLENGPLLRAGLIHMDDAEQILMLTLHHIVSDGWSMNILVRELSECYLAHINDVVPVLPVLPVQYGDFSYWQRHWLQGDVLRSQLNYWTEQLRGAPPVLTLPTDFPRPATQQYRGITHEFSISRENVQTLRAICRETQTTLYMVLSAAFNILLSRYSGQNDICVGMPIANRNHPGIESLIGFFVNTLVLRTRLDGNQSFQDLLEQVRTNAFDAYAHQDLPFEKLVDALRPEREGGYAPIFQVMFLLQNVSAANAAFADLEIENIPVERGIAKFDLTLYATETDGALHCGFEYDAALFKQDTIVRMAKHFDCLLATIGQQPDCILDDLELSSYSTDIPDIVAGPAPCGPIALSYHQERLWFVDEFERNRLYEASPTYHNIPLLLQIDGEIDAERLEAAINQVIARHSVLRTHIVTSDAQGWQHIAPGASLTIAQHHCKEDDATEIALAYAMLPFSLSTDLLIRAQLVRYSEERAILCVTAHHAVTDRLSMQIIGREILRAYDADTTNACLEQVLQYADYMHWQRYSDPSCLQEQALYWRHQLQGTLQVMELPLKCARPAVHVFEPAWHGFDIDAELDKALSGLAASEACSTSDILLAGFEAVLRRYVPHDEIVVGTSISGRHRENLADVVGPLANLVVIRNQVPTGMPLRDVLVQVIRSTRGANRHPDLPFDQLVSIINPVKDMSRTALFDVLFQSSEHEESSWQAESFVAHPIETNLGYGKYDLHLYMHRLDGVLHGDLVYNGLYFDTALVRNLMRHYVRMLAAMCKNLSQSVGHADILVEFEIAQQIALANPHHARYPDHQTLHALIEEQVERTPTHIAVVCDEERISYRELNVRANQLAHYLLTNGVQRSQLVALFLERSVDMIVAILAVLKTGAAYAPLDPTHPAERIEFMLGDCSPSLIICNSGSGGRLSLRTSHRVELDTDAASIAAQPSHNPDHAGTPDDLAYVIYTSGSTGLPKGSLLTHRNVVRLILNDRLQFSFGSNDVWSMFHSYTFDFSVWEMYGALLYGAGVVVVPDPVRKDPARFLDLLVNEKVSVLSQTPSAFQSLVQEVFKHKDFVLPNLRYIVFGGENLNPTLLKDFHDAYPHIDLINMYGITETCVHVTFKRIEARDIEAGVNNIGVPIPTTTVYILDSHQHLMPLGVPGEICVGGLGVGRGYLGRDKLTEERFIQHPYESGERLYRSGDLGKLLENGEFVYLGRMDKQIKIRGFRVELGEIEVALTRLPEIRDAVVRLHEDANGDSRLVAYVIYEISAGAPDTSALRTALSLSLPDYMIPAHWIVLSHLPLTANGKLNIKALPAPDLRRGQTGYVAPRTKIEAELAVIWSNILGLDQVGVTDNFFELGGHSLLATRLTSKIRAEFRVDLALRVVFEAPTIEQFAERVQSSLQSASNESESALIHVRPANIPLSFAQERIWFIEQINQGTSLFNMPNAVRLSGELDTHALETAFNEIIIRHEILRTRFLVSNGIPEQVVEPHRHLTLRYLDLSHFPSGERDANLAAQLATSSNQAFDLAVAPLMRIDLYKIRENDHVLLLNMHHIVSDGWSTNLVVHELSELYSAACAGTQATLTQLTMQYADFAIWQRNWLQGEKLNLQLNYWEAKLAGAPTLQLPLDHPRPAAQTFVGQACKFTIGTAISEPFTALCRAADVTPFMGLLAAFSVMLAKLSNQHDISIGTTIANRNRSETESMIGFFANLMVIRTNLSHVSHFHELLEQVRDITIDAYANQDVSFHQVVERIQPKRDTSRSPLFQVNFVLHNTSDPSYTEASADQTVKFAGLTVESVDNEFYVAQYDLSLHVVERSVGYDCTLLYNSDLFDPDTITRWANYFEHLLTSFITSPKTCLTALPIPEHQLRQLNNWQTGIVPASTGRCLHDVFEEQVVLSPASVALLTESGPVTYEELNRRANRIAHYLMLSGASQETRIGLCLERGPEAIVCILGILKAGGCYVPVDFNLPEERLSEILHAAELGIMLTSVDLVDKLPAFQLTFTKVICLETDAREIAACANTNPGRPGIASQLAYIMFTSGSTGRAKAVMISHGNVTRLAKTPSFITLDDTEVFLLVSPLTFDASTIEIWGALLNGAKLAIASPHMHAVDAIAEAVTRHHVSVLWLTAGLFNAIVDHRPEILCSLRQLLTGGDALSAQHVRQAQKLLSKGVLINGYGPTETTTFASTYRIPDLSEELQSVPIGKPISGTRLYVLDPYMQPAPIGSIGELYIGDLGVARGYLAAPALTAERFLADPFADKPGSRMYRSGDLVRWLENGSLDFVGRADQQIKLRGFRIEPSEIENAILEDERIADAVVVSRHILDGEKQLLAYWSAGNGDSAPSASDLKARLLARLPSYMVPTFFIQVQAMPLTTNGKIDMASLPGPENFTGVSDTQIELPGTAQESLVIEVWQALLHVGAISVHDSFFDLGGDSLRAIQLKAMLAHRGYDFELQQLFSHPTVRELASLLTKNSHSASGEEHVAFKLVSESDRLRLPADAEDAYPLSHLQQGMLFHSVFEEDSALYHDVIGYRLRMPFMSALWNIVFQQLSARHEILRTGILLTELSEPLQVVYSHAEIPVEQHDCQLLADQDLYYHEWSIRQAKIPFEWSKAPLLRVFLHRWSDTEFQLTLNFHHAILDGWSEASLATEILQRYQALLDGIELDVPMLEAHMRDYIVEEQRALSRPEVVHYWQEVVLDYSPTKLQQYKPSLAPEKSGMLETISLSISAEESQQLQQLAKQTRVPLKTLLLALHFKVLSQFSGLTDVATGIVTHGRPELVDGDKILGLFLNTLPLRLHLQPENWLDLIQRTADAEQTLYKYRHFPLHKVMQLAGGQRLFDVLFNFTNFHVYQNLDEQTLSAVLDRTGLGENSLPFSVDFSLSPKMLVEGSISYDPEQYDQRWINEIATGYQNFIKAMISDPFSSHLDQGLVNSAAYHHPVPLPLLTADTSDNQPLHRLFELQAARTPGQIAIESHGETISYAVLNARSNQLARHLREQGIGADALVGICLDRSANMIVSLLAVLKAGAAYLPLDPAYPSARLSAILSDASPKILISQKESGARITHPDTPTFYIDQDQSQLHSYSSDNLPTGCIPENLAYAIYTSGSTGKPKGVLITHANVTQHANTHIKTCGLTTDDVVLQFASLAFDASVEEIFPPLLTGAKIVLRPQELPSTGLAFSELLQDKGITVLDLPTAFWHEWTQAMLTDATPLPESLRIVIVGGEKAHAETLQQWHTLPGSKAIRWINTYGPTETTISSTCFEADNRGAYVDLPIGRPNVNTQVYVLNSFLQPVPYGVKGEVYIGGAGVARAYLNMPGMTSERFVADPFGTTPGARMYRTGDIACHQHDGNLLYIGRSDSQVKLRGFRIELAEIEAALQAQAGVSQTTVLVREDVPGDQRLVAYVVAATGEVAPVGSVLRESLTRTLPEFMVPAHIVVLDKFPVNNSGKIERKNLPAPDVQYQADSYVAPRNYLESVLADIWADVLSLDRVGIHDNFFALGGHSLLCLKLFHKVTKQLNVRLPIASIFSGPTVAQLAEAVSANQQSHTYIVPLQPYGDGVPLFLVHPAGGQVFSYRELALELGNKFPVYGIQSPEVDNTSRQFDNLNAMASAYCQTIRSIQAFGPYQLAGWSTGGLIATAIAETLQSQGEKVSYLGLIDTRLVGNDHSAHDDTEQASILLTLLSNLRGREFSSSEILGMETDMKQAGLDVSTFLSPENEASALLYIHKWTGVEISSELLSDISAQTIVMQGHISLLTGYQAQFDSVAIHRYQAAIRSDNDDSLPGEFVDGDHFSMLREPQVTTLAQKMLTSLS